MAPDPSIRRPPRPSSSPGSRRRLGLAAAALLLLVGAITLGSVSPPDAAEATVAPARGFRATVLGWSSWYGSYAMGPAGSAWCIDHGLRAPDPSFRYVPTTAPDLDAATGAAIAWIVTAHPGDDPLDAAAIMLAVHDLRRASYPFGVLDVDRLQPHDLAGFGGREVELISRARAAKAEARAHAALRGPFRLTLTLARSGEPAGASARDPDGRATATLTDAGGRPVVGAGIAVDAQHATIDGAAAGPTGADGSFTVAYRVAAATPGQQPQLTAHAILPNPVPATYASSTVRAQRVVRGAWLGLEAHATPAPVPATTSTTSTSTSTSTTRTTSTTTRPTTTATSTTTTTGPPHATVPPTSSTTSTSPATTSTTSTTTTASTAARAPAPPGTGEQLPRTGARSVGWTLIGAGLVLLGATLLAVSRGWAR